MKIAARSIDGFLEQPPAKVRAILLYGPDTGLLRERAQLLLRNLVGSTDDAFRIVTLAPADLRDDPARLVDEMAALSLTGGRRVIRVRGSDARTAERAREVLDDPRDGDSVLLVEAGELAPRDAVRKLFEQHDRAAAVPCYADDERTLEGVIEQALRTAELSVEPAALAYLIASLGADRGVTRQEIEKLVVYKSGDDDRNVSGSGAKSGSPIAASSSSTTSCIGYDTAPSTTKERTRF